MHELLPGQSLQIPLTPESEAVRVVSHVFAKGGLEAGIHAAELDVSIMGRSGSRKERLTLPLSAGQGRATAEEPELTVGDPYGSSVDVAGTGAGEMRLTLQSVASATGILVRVIRREAVPRQEVQRRSAQLSAAERGRMAAHAWEPSWSDLPAGERDALLGFRWRSVATVGGTGVSRALALAPGQHETRGYDVPLVWRSSLRGGERSSFIARRDMSLLVSAASAEVALKAVVRAPSGEERTTEANGDLRVNVPASSSIEVDARADATVTVRADDPSALEESNLAVAWRVGPGRPMLVTATLEPLVLRVTARSPLARGSHLGSVRVRCTIGTGRFLHEATVERSPVDRYEGLEPDATPSEPTSFYVTLPVGGTAQLESEQAVDLSLAELDPNAPTKVIGYPAVAAPAFRIRGATSWQGFVARRPTNAVDLESLRVRLGRVIAPVIPRELPKTVRIRRPQHLPTRTLDERLFVEGNSVDLDVTTTGEAISIPIHLMAGAPVVVSVLPRSGTTGSLRAARLSRWVTLAHEVRGPDTRAVIVLGDDLVPGQKTVRLTSEAPFSLHVPWERRPEKPHWTEGDYEP